MKEKNVIPRTLLTVVVFVFVGYYIYSNRNYFEILMEVNWVYFVSLSTLISVASFFNAAQNAVLIRSLGVPLSDLESFGLSNISALVNLVLPHGVTITKAVYLKQRYSVSYSKFSALFMGLLVIFLLIAALLMAVTNTIATLQGVTVPPILWVVSFLGTSSSLLFFFDLPRAFLGRLGRVGLLLENFSDGWKEIRSNKPRLIKACLWQVAIFVISGLGVTVAYHSTGIDINPLLGISLSVFIGLSNLIVFIPGNIGVQEVVYGYLSYLSGLLFVQGVAISALMRAVSLTVTLMIAPFSWYFLFFRQGIKLR